MYTSNLHKHLEIMTSINFVYQTDRPTELMISLNVWFFSLTGQNRGVGGLAALLSLVCFHLYLFVPIRTDHIHMPTQINLWKLPSTTTVQSAATEQLHLRFSSPRFTLSILRVELMLSPVTSLLL